MRAPISLNLSRNRPTPRRVPPLYRDSGRMSIGKSCAFGSFATYSLHHLTDEQKTVFLPTLQDHLNEDGQLLICATPAALRRIVFGWCWSIFKSGPKRLSSHMRDREFPARRLNGCYEYLENQKNWLTNPRFGIILLSGTQDIVSVFYAQPTGCPQHFHRTGRRGLGKTRSEREGERLATGRTAKNDAAGLPRQGRLHAVY